MVRRAAAAIHRSACGTAMHDLMFGDANGLREFGGPWTGDRMEFEWREGVRSRRPPKRRSNASGMADIFLSYAREDKDLASIIAGALEAAGFSVWIDRQVPTASKWKNLLESELGTARCVVMLWSDHAMNSRYVRHEGRAGFERAALVPVLLSKAEIPRLFRSIQFADLTAWNGDPGAQAFREILVAVRRQMLPHPRIGFDSLFHLRRDDIKQLYGAYLDVAGRLGFVPIPGRFQLPKSAAEERRLHRAIDSLQVAVHWDWRLKALFENASRHPTAVDRARRVERHIPVLWLGYSSILDHSSRAT
jgi:hypothetical protein